VRRAGLSATVLGTKVIFAGGRTVGRPLPIGTIDATMPGVPTGTVDIYDSVTGEWSAAMLVRGRSHPAVTAVGSKAFFAGGVGASGNSDVLDIYDGATNEWSTATPSYPRWTTATSTGTQAIFAGGYTVPPTVDREAEHAVDIYDDTVREWSTMRLPSARPFRLAVTVGSRAIFAGALFPSPSAGMQRADSYDSVTRQWDERTLSQPRWPLVATTVGTRALFAGALAGPPGEPGLVDIYDHLTGRWTTAALSVARGYMVATAVGNLGILAGGATQPSDTPPNTISYSIPSDAVDIYDAVADQWSRDTLPQPRIYSVATAVGTKALFAGGTVERRLSDAVDIYDSARRR
jgi:hypothetical protein